MRAFYGKYKTKWETEAPVRDKTVTKNINILPGLKDTAKQNKPNSPLESWKLLVTDNIIEQIVVCAIAKIRSV